MTSGVTQLETCLSHIRRRRDCGACKSFVVDVAYWELNSGFIRAGRKDDVLVLGSGKLSAISGKYVHRTDSTRKIGEKVVPIPQESLIGSSPAVQGAVMFGRGRSQCGILIEPRPENAIVSQDLEALASFRNLIWYVSSFR